MIATTRLARFSVFIALLHMTIGQKTGCPIADDPKKLLSCVSFNLMVFYEISENKLEGVCQTAIDYLHCARQYVRGCPAENLILGAVIELENLIDNCCNNNGPNQFCPVPGAGGSTTTPKQMNCFPGGTYVTMADGKPKLIESVHIGDVVKAVDSQGQIVDSEVFMFLDNSPNVTAEYVVLVTSNGERMRATPSHLVAVKSSTGLQYKHASSVQTGEQLLTAVDGSLKPSAVVATRRLHLRGAFAPLTLEGSLLVDNAAASCYAVVTDQWIAQWALAPARLAHYATKSALGVSAWARQADGVHWVPAALWQLAELALPSVVVQ